MKLAMIGGSGLYQLEGLTNTQELAVDTPFGQPSGKILTGMLNNVDVCFLPRHGIGHYITPSEINYRANIFALKSLGVTHIVSVSAVGSLKEELPPGMLVIPDQFFDRTYKREGTFFGDGIVGHVSMADPFCEDLRQRLLAACQKADVPHSFGGTYVCMEGPGFSTRAESHFYRSINASIIGMTNMPEAKLAREAGMSYATLALSTDYDCWHVSEEPVTAQEVVKVMNENVAKAKRVIQILTTLMTDAPTPFKGIFKQNTVTDFARIPNSTKEKLKLLLEDGDVR